MTTPPEPVPNPYWPSTGSITATTIAKPSLPDLASVQAALEVFRQVEAYLQAQ